LTQPSINIHCVILSGGMDSITLADFVRSNLPTGVNRIELMSFFYGQRHHKELNCARAYARKHSLPHTIIDISFLSDLTPGSSQTDLRVPVPEGEYDAPSMSLTVVPGRNTIMLSIAASHLESLVKNARRADPESRVAGGSLYFGAHAGDHHIYPDCRPHYINMMRDTLIASSEGDVLLRVPFMMMSKGEIVRRGAQLGTDYANTWTCYKGEEFPCGVCGSCDERREAFVQAGVEDPALAPSY
jgi:7-cyano-7-deazaguanine synthase